MDALKIPIDLELKNIIDKLANFVARNGPEFEEMTKSKQHDNLKFSFLFGGDYYPYYKKRVSDECASLQQNSINSAPWQQIPPPPILPPQIPNIYNNNSIPNGMNPNFSIPYMPVNDFSYKPNVNQIPNFMPINSQQSQPFYPNQIINSFSQIVQPPISIVPNSYDQNSLHRDKQSCDYSNYEYLKSIGLSQEILEKIKESQENLSNYLEQLKGQQQVEIENIILESQNTKITNLSKECGIDLNEIESVLKPIKETCTKEAISNGKCWILKNNNSPVFPEFVGRYILKQIMGAEEKFDTRLHLVYLINDLMHHCVRKNVQSLRSALDYIIIPIFCQTYTSANVEQKEKLDKLLRLWENNNYFKPDYLADLKVADKALSNYKSDLISEYGDAIHPVKLKYDELYKEKSKRHEMMVDELVNNQQSYRAKPPPIPPIPNSPFPEYLHSRNKDGDNSGGHFMSTTSHRDDLSPSIKMEEQFVVEKSTSLLGNPPPSFNNTNQQLPLPDFNVPPPNIPNLLNNNPINPSLFKDFLGKMNYFTSNQDNPASFSMNPVAALSNFMQNMTSGGGGNNMPAGAPNLPPQMMMFMLNLMKNFTGGSGANVGSYNLFPPTGVPNPMMAFLGMMMNSGGGNSNPIPPNPIMFAMMKKMMENMSTASSTIPSNNILSSPPPSLMGLAPSAGNSSSKYKMDPIDKTIIPSLPYFDLPAGLMVKLVKEEEVNYKSIDPNDIRLPAPDPPTEQLINAVEAFYSQPTHETPRNSEGWEHLGLFEFYKVKAKYKKAAALEKGKKTSTTTSLSDGGCLHTTRSKDTKSRSASKTPDRNTGRARSHSRSSHSSQSSISSVTISRKEKSSIDETGKEGGGGDHLSNISAESAEENTAKKEKTDKKKKKRSTRKEKNRRNKSRTPEKRKKQEETKRIFRETPSDEDEDRTINGKRRSPSKNREERSSRRARRSRSRSRHRHGKSKSRTRSRSPPPPTFSNPSRTSDEMFAIKDISDQQRLDEDNKGHQLLKKMGWKGAGLGLNEQGTHDPISGGEIRETARKYEGVGGAKTQNEMKAFEEYRKVRCKALYNR